MRARPALAVLLAVATVSASLQAAAQVKYTERDLALLPQWCRHTQLIRDTVPGGRDPAEYQRMMTITKGMFQHLHHYCYGLIAQNRATFQARDAREREQRLRESLREFDYVLQQSPPDFLMLPEILTKRADSLIRLGAGAQGESELRRALGLKADYWPAWLALADYYYEKVGDAARAADTLEQGIAAAPNATALQERLAERRGAKRR